MTSAGALLICVTFLTRADSVEPSELNSRPELVGRELIIDDRVRYFLESKRGQGYDQIVFKRADALFRLPARLKMARPPSEANAQVKGVLRMEEGRLVFDVTAIEMLPGDTERLESEIGKLRREDYLSRRNWALWAERRGKELAEPKLETRGIDLETEALWIEAARPAADPLALVARSVGRPIPISMRNTLAHRGLRDRFNRAATLADLEALATQIESLLPNARIPSTATLDPGILREYAKEPGEAYLAASEQVQAGLDRKLLADILQKQFERQVEASPVDAAKLTDLARARLPDRPELVDRLARQALLEAESKVASMRQSEVEELAATFRDRGEAERSRRLIQSWLADRRKNRLSASDAEGRILLALNYEKMLSDRSTAAELLREALAIDPASRGAADAFLRMGFRRGEQGWFDPEQTSISPTSGKDRDATPDSKMTSSDTGNSLRGLTRAQVRSRLGGRPDQIVRSASQGRSVELWIYRNGKGTQVIRFVFEASTTEPRASSAYADQK